jgi:hypothetical protein
VFAASTIHTGLLDASDLTFVGAALAGGEGASITVDTGWMGFYGAPSPAMRVVPGTKWTSIGGGRVFGLNCPGPRLLVANGEKFYFPDGGAPKAQFAPNITGTGSDASIGGSVSAFSAFPFYNSTNYAMATMTTE